MPARCALHVRNERSRRQHLLQYGKQCARSDTSLQVDDSVTQSIGGERARSVQQACRDQPLGLHRQRRQLRHDHRRLQLRGPVVTLRLDRFAHTVSLNDQHQTTSTTMSTCPFRTKVLQITRKDPGHRCFA